jgi:hypothetical protein
MSLKKTATEMLYELSESDTNLHIKLNNWEEDFIENLIEHVQIGGDLSEKQEEKIKEIYEQYFG